MVVELFKSMTPEQYMAERVDQYQKWYDRKSVGAKSRYMTMRAASVVGAAVVPVIVNGPYRGLKKEAAFSLLVERCEGQISAENSATLNVLVVAAQQPEANDTGGTRKT